MNVMAPADTGTGVAHTGPLAVRLNLEMESMRAVSAPDGRGIRVPCVGPIEVGFGNRFCYVGDLVLDPDRRAITVNPANPDIPHVQVESLL